MTEFHENSNVTKSVPPKRNFRRRILWWIFLVLVLFYGYVFVYFVFTHIYISKETILGEETYKCEMYRRYQHCYEMPLTLETFQRYARQNGWTCKPVTKPFKIMRFTYGYFCQDFYDFKEALPQDETPTSGYHFVTEGFYFMLENGATVHVVYDSRNQTLYYYSRRCHGGGDTQEEINPLWKENKPDEQEHKNPEHDLDNIAF